MANPRGQQRDKPYRDALRRAIARAENGKDEKSIRRRLDSIADAHLDAAATGDLSAVKELADRLDGKVAQAIVGDDEAPPVQVATIERVIIDPANQDG